MRTVPGGAPRLAWRARLGPWAHVPEAPRCDGALLPTCVLAPGAVPGQGPFTLRLSASGDAVLEVSAVHYVWRAEVPP